MRLWNDYEGTTIADVYPIEKLIRPEGRSAFFSTSNGTGIPAVIRLIESINDESEILKRWKTVADLKENHLITLKKFGQTIFEGTPLIYVLMESTETDLGSILRQGTLSVEETRELAISLVDAVSALHGSGIVHEHIESANVLAAGEVVKLRSDCIREAPEGDEGIALMRQDVHDIATVLLQALTQRTSLETIGATRLPAPFEAIIRNGMSGKWGLAQMAAALNPPAANVVATSIPASPAARGPVTAGDTAPTTPARAEQMPLVLSDETPAVQTTPASEPRLSSRISVPIEDEEITSRKRWWGAVAPAAVMIVAALSWYSFHKPTPANETVRPITSMSDGSSAESSKAEAPAPVAAAAAAPVPPPVQAMSEDGPRWRVISFTYNHQDQAQHKVDELMQKDASLRPEVFSPNGSSYLVALGGMMSKDAAAAFRQQAIAKGLPHDTYIQNYEGRGRRRARR